MKIARIPLAILASFLVLFASLSVLAMENSLMEAIYGGDIARVQGLIAAGVDVDARFEQGITPLTFALLVENSSERMLAVLLDAGADFEIKDDYGHTALTFAAMMSNSLEAVQLLLDRGAEVNAVNMFGRTALCGALIEKADPEIILALLAAGADVNIVDQFRETSFLIAIWNGHGAEIIGALIEAGADVNFPAEDGQTPLMAVLSTNADFDLVKLLLEAGSEVNRADYDGVTALRTALINDVDPIVIELLLEEGADPCLTDYFGETPVEVGIAFSSSTKSVELLLEAGVDPNSKTVHGTSLLSYAIDKASNPQTAISLLVAGADPNVKNEWGRTPLMEALMWNPRYDVIEAMIVAGADFNIASDEGKTAWDLVQEDPILARMPVLLQLRSSSVGAGEKNATVILNGMCRVVGGVLEGKWLSMAEIVNHLYVGQKYMIYYQNAPPCEAFAYDVSEEYYNSGDIGYFVPLEADLWGEFAITGNWNALPRLPIIEENVALEEDVVLLLEQRGIQDLTDFLSRSIFIDLDNDGTVEVLIEVTNMGDAEFNHLLEYGELDRTNLYSVLILRHNNDKGAAISTVIAENYQELVVNKVEFIGDLNGDGNMEFYVDSMNVEALLAEGWATNTRRLYKFKDGSLEKIFSNYSHPI